MRCGVSEVSLAAANPLSSRSRNVGAGRTSLVDAGGTTTFATSARSKLDSPAATRSSETT